MVAGRPRDFDVNEALDAALHVFWEKGYEGASLSDLTAAMGINRPSLYAAFGNKEELFRKALASYCERSAFFAAALEQPRTHDVAEKLLYGYADNLSDTSRPRGCLIINAALACSETAEPVRQELIARRQGNQEKIAERFRRAKRENDFPADCDPEEMASYISTISHGMAVQSASGASRADLRQIAKMALRALGLNK